MKRNTMLTYLPSYRLPLVVVLLCASTAAVANPLADLQTLFYTPAQRQDMSRSRLGPEGAQGGATSHLNGVVHRAAGKGTVWINNQPHREGSAPVGPIRGVDALVEGRQLRVGESLDKASGERTDVLVPGALRVQSKP